MEKPKIIEVSSKEVLIEEGKEVTCLYFIQEGQVEILEKGEKDHTIPLAVVGPGEFIGEMAILNNQKASATARTLTSVKAYVFTRQAIESQFKAVPSWLISLLKTSLSRVSSMNEILRRNNLVDEKIMNEIRTAEIKDKKEGPE